MKLRAGFPYLAVKGGELVAEFTLVARAGNYYRVRCESGSFWISTDALRAWLEGCELYEVEGAYGEEVEI